MGFGYDAQAIEAARRGSARSATLIRRQMRQGLNSLATIASTAAWFGLFGTVLGMVNSFKGCGGERSICMAATVAGVSESLMWTAFGLVVALEALWFYRYLSTQVEAFEIEMKSASLQLANDLSLHLRRE
jgi:biopolymer transport protein ExbB/TolQ